MEFAIGRQKGAPPSASDGDMEETPLLGMRTPFGRRENRIERRSSVISAGKPYVPEHRSKHDDVIGLAPFERCTVM